MKFKIIAALVFAVILGLFGVLGQKQGSNTESAADSNAEPIQSFQGLGK